VTTGYGYGQGKYRGWFLKSMLALNGFYETQNFCDLDFRKLLDAKYEYKCFGQGFQTLSIKKKVTQWVGNS